MPSDQSKDALKGRRELSGSTLSATLREKLFLQVLGALAGFEPGNRMTRARGAMSWGPPNKS